MTIKKSSEFGTVDRDELGMGDRDRIGTTIGRRWTTTEKSDSV